MTIRTRLFAAALLVIATSAPAADFEWFTKLHIRAASDDEISCSGQCAGLKYDASDFYLGGQMGGYWTGLPFMKLGAAAEVTKAPGVSARVQLPLRFATLDLGYGATWPTARARVDGDCTSSSRGDGDYYFAELEIGQLFVRYSRDEITHDLDRRERITDSSGATRCQTTDTLRVEQTSDSWFVGWRIAF